MTTWVLYHANCYDGFGAAWAAWKALGVGAQYRAVNHGEPPPVMTDDGMPEHVYILDFSYPRDLLSGLSKMLMRGDNPRLTVLDHHKSAKEDLAGFPFATFDLEKSGAVLAWEHFHPGKPVPSMLQYVQDRDLWKFKLPHSREVAAWMRSWPFGFQLWNGLASRHEGVGRDADAIEYIWQEGEAILRFQQRQVELMADNAVWITLGGHKVHAANATVFFSEVGEELCTRYPDEPFAVYWLDRPEGKRQWGLRSRGEFDCTKVARHYGGGGHPGAAGFVTGQSFWGEPA